jgi:flagellar motor switch protein FliM
MSEFASQSEILSREELDALLSALAEGRSEQERRDKAAGGLPFGARVASRPRPVRLPGLQRAVERFAEEEGRILSSAHQKKIEFRVIGWDEVSLEEFGDTLLGNDRVVVFELGPPPSIGFMVVGRPLFYSLLGYSFGARPGASRPLVSPTPYTQIEMRFMRRVAAEMLQQLERSWNDLTPVGARVLSIDEPKRLQEDRHDMVMMASLDVSGLGEICRLRLALPLAPFASLEGKQKAVEPGRQALFEKSVLEMPVSLHVEAGQSELSLSQLAHLQPGDFIPLVPLENGELLITVEGEAKFRAVRGIVGGRIAVQVTRRL